ncbi:MAG: hypothetical protein AAF725_16065 [Acidobacteriota bacterium]
MEHYYIRVGDQEIPLPQGVTVADWSRERTYWQNPRIRAFLGCIRMLGGVMESNYAILHCSPERLAEIWRRVREVSDLMLTQLAPLLDNPSPFPALEEARSHAEVSLTMLSESVLSDLEQFTAVGGHLPEERLMEVRKLLCVSIGKIHAFLQDTFGQIMAGDPRSQHDADYFLSRRFPQDVEEAEWLHSTVERLRDYLADLDRDREELLAPTLRSIREEQSVPTERAWLETQQFLDVVDAQLTPKLKEVLALRGIRFHEMEIIDRYAVDLPVRCNGAATLWQAAREVNDAIKSHTGESRPEREQAVRDLMHCHGLFAARLIRLLGDIDQTLRDLMAFVPLWLDGIEMRRALLMRRSSEAHEAVEARQTELANAIASL